MLPENAYLPSKFSRLNHPVAFLFGRKVKDTLFYILLHQRIEFCFSLLQMWAIFIVLKITLLAQILIFTIMFDH